MKNCFRRFCSLLLSLVLIATILVPVFHQVEAASYEIYKDYTTPSGISDYGGCTSLQGFTCNATYGYSVKINGAESLAVIYRTTLNGGTSTKMTDTSDGSYYFAGLGHANDLDVANINGTDYLFVATGGTGDYDIVSYKISGTTLTKVGGYNITYNGADAYASSAQVLHKDASTITFIVKSNKTFYTFTINASATSGTYAMTAMFTINVTDVVIEGVSKNLSNYLQQGFCYYDNKVYVPMTGNTDANLSAIVVYDIEGASGTIKSDPTLSFFFTSLAYSDLFEVESCGICPADGKLYFATNRRKSSSDYNHDGVHYVDDYIYDPSYDDLANSGNFRWETSGDELASVTTDGNSFNSATLYSGSVSSGTFTDAQYSLDKTIKLYHDVPWVIEWQSEGAWTSGSLLFSSTRASSYTGNTFFFRRKNSTLMAFGSYSGSQFNNYGIALSDYGIDGAAAHVYRLENRIASDGSNMVYLWVDGRELGAMNNYYIAGTAQGTTSNWLSGKDFEFSYLGTIEHPVDTCSMEYI